MSIDGSGASRAGGDGLHNEDAFLVEDGLGLYVVCDGVSEGAAGEVAAQIALEAVSASIHRSEQELDVRRGRVARFAVEKAMKRAAHALAAAQHTDPGLQGLATTVTMLLAHGRWGIIGHRGDSRAYLIRRARSHQLTVDHELTETSDHASAEPHAFDVFAVELEAGDTIVLCTDGAEQVVEDSAIIRAAGRLSPRFLSSRIVQAARELDPTLDATAVVIRVRGEDEIGWLELSRASRPTAFGHMLNAA